MGKKGDAPFEYCEFKKGPVVKVFIRSRRGTRGARFLKINVRLRRPSGERGEQVSMSVKDQNAASGSPPRERGGTSARGGSLYAHQKEGRV